MYWTGDSIVPVIDTPYRGGGVPDVLKGREEGGIAPPWARVLRTVLIAWAVSLPQVLHIVPYRYRVTPQHSEMIRVSRPAITTATGGKVLGAALRYTYNQPTAVPIT